MSEFWQTLFVQLLNHILGFDSDIWTNKWRVEPLPGLALPVVSVSIFPIIEAPPDSDYLSLLRLSEFAQISDFNGRHVSYLSKVSISVR